MTGSDKAQKISKLEELQLPLKGFMKAVETGDKKRVMWLEGMGDGRFRIHLKKQR